jgi:hypothetical protein
VTPWLLVPRRPRNGVVDARSLLSRGRGSRCGQEGLELPLGVGNSSHWLMATAGRSERAVLAAGFGPDSMNAGGLPRGWAPIGLRPPEAGGWAIALGRLRHLDGRLARAQHRSGYGKFVDSTLDRFVETFAFRASRSTSPAGRTARWSGRRARLLRS